MKRCQHCNTPISPTSRAHAKFCNSRCRNAYHNQMTKGLRDAAEKGELNWSTRTWAINLFLEKREAAYSAIAKVLPLSRKQMEALERESREGRGEG